MGIYLYIHFNLNYDDITGMNDDTRILNILLLFKIISDIFVWNIYKAHVLKAVICMIF